MNLKTSPALEKRTQPPANCSRCCSSNQRCFQKWTIWARWACFLEKIEHFRLYVPFLFHTDTCIRSLIHIQKQGKIPTDYTRLQVRMTHAYRRLSPKYLYQAFSFKSLGNRHLNWGSPLIPQICCFQVTVSSRIFSCKTICHLLKNSQILTEPLLIHLLYIKWKIQTTRNIMQFLQRSVWSDCADEMADAT